MEFYFRAWVAEATAGHGEGSVMEILGKKVRTKRTKRTKPPFYGAKWVDS